MEHGVPVNADGISCAARRFSRLRLWRAAILVALIAACLRAALLAWFCADAKLSLASVFAGHDGGEYLRFAQALANFDPAAIPADARRHDAGWPALIALFSWAAPLWAAAMGLITGGFAVMAAAFMRILERHATIKPRRCWLAALILLAGYPSYVYFACFALGETAFVALLLLALAAYLGGLRALAYALAGLCAAIRSPGIFLAAAFCLNDLVVYGRGGWRKCLSAPLALIPPLAWMLISHRCWNATAAATLELRMGWPFSGFRGFAETGLFRTIYVFLCVIFSVAGVALLALEASRARWSDPFLNTGTFYCLLYLLLHFCIRSFRNMEAVQYPFSYMDRYMIGVLPFVIYGWRRLLLRPGVVAAAVSASLALAAWWGHHYFAALAIAG